MVLEKEPTLANYAMDLKTMSTSVRDYHKAATL